MESLYRKYRPQTFADVVGQQHVVGTLQRAVMEGRTSHAYLFCGPRGTGKTTMARLLAKSLMCEQGPSQLPDGTCEQCELIAAGEHPDVYELDAASRTGVDNVREEIINRVGYAPVRGRYKVYIIDEVHMLTTAAFNALLKTLEEPPSHVVFVLCTTDPQKIPATILSRVQRFDFRPIGNDDIHRRLAYVCEQEGFAFEDAALNLVVRHARGGMRDALSTLEQLSVFGGGSITSAAAQDLLGSVPGAEMDHVVEALAARDVPMLFLQVGELIESGRDPLQFTRDLAARVRDIYVVALVGPRPEVLDTSADVSKLQSEADAFGSVDRLARVLSLLGGVVREMATAPNQRLVLEIAFTRIARPAEDLSLDSLAERVAELEGKVRALLSGGVVPVEAAQVPKKPESESDSPTAAEDARVMSSGNEQARSMSELPVEPAAAAVSESAQPTPSQPKRPTHASQPAQASQPVSAPQPQPTWSQPTFVASSRPAQAQPIPAASSEPAPQPQEMQPSQAVVDAGELQRRWRTVVTEMISRLPSRGSLLSNAVACSDDGSTIEVNLPKGSSFALKMLERPDIRAAVEEVVAEVFGKRTITFYEGMVMAAAAAESAPVPRTAPAPQPTPAQQPAPAPQPVSDYPMPWDEPSGVPEAPFAPDPMEPVPYDEIDAAVYEQPPAYEPAPFSQPAPVQRQPSAPQPSVQPAPSEQPAQTPKPASQSTPPRQSAPTPEPAPQPSVPQAPDDLPADLAAVLANAFEVFGTDVKVKR